MRYRLLTILFLCVSLHLTAQQSDLIAKTQGITSTLHRENIGRIIFTDKYVPVSKLQSVDFLTNYQLTNKSNLFITVFMANSVTNYMHRLAPQLSTDSLDKIGNFQFNLFVDGHLIHSSNLWPGAPRPATNDTATIISKPLIDNSNEGGWWSQSFWGRFMNNGGDSALTEGKHLLRMEIRCYIKLGNQIKTGNLIASGKLNMDIYRKPKLDISKTRISPLKPYNGLPLSTDKFDENKIRLLRKSIDEAIFKHISGIIVLKNGKLLIEEYYNGETRDSLHDPRSVGKSFSSTITGIAIHDGHLKNEFQPLKDFYDLRSYANYSPEKGNMPLYNLLTMSSVFDGNDDDDNSPGNEENMYPTANWVKFALDLPVTQTIPRGQWHYFTAGVILLGDILNKSVPGGLQKYADENLFKPLGITDYHWDFTPQQVPNTAGGIRLKALDFAKYGQLYKNNGVWDGKQIIPKEWITKTFTRQKALPGRPGEYYGYLFWNKTYHVNGKAYETWYCAGNGGNSIFIFKDQPLVVVVTATAYGQNYAHPQVDKIMEQYILPAVTR